MEGQSIVKIQGKKRPKDLVEEGKISQQKTAQKNLRAQKRNDASINGNRKEGRSNQEVRGDHNTNQRRGNSDSHTKSLARRAKEQNAADLKNSN